MNYRRLYTVLFSIVLVVALSCSSSPFVWDDAYDLSVMSFNIRYDTSEDGDNQWSNRKEACVSAILANQTSIVGVQEALSHQVDYLDDQMPDYDYVGVGRDDGATSGEYCAIFYHTALFELMDSGTFWLSETPDVPSRGWDANNTRITTWAELRDRRNDKVIYVFNTHFDHVGVVAREESAKLLMQRINDIAPSDAPVFITGDFNALIRGHIFEPIQKECYSARRYAKYTDGIKSFNFFGKWYLSRNIDFIFYKNAEALAFRTIAEEYNDVPFISDHYPIITQFNY